MLKMQQRGVGGYRRVTGC